MNSLVASPFWQSVDEQWIGAVLIALTVMILLSLCISLVRARSLNMYLIALGLLVLSAGLLAPKADSQSPRVFQLWLLSPEILGRLSIFQILLTTVSVFGSIRQEWCRERAGKLFHELRSRFIAAVTVLPSPILLVFIFWVEQNMMMATREVAPVLIGIKVGVVLAVLIGMVSFLLSWFNRYQLISLHFLTGFFLVASGALLPCLTIKLSFRSFAAEMPYAPSLPTIFLLLILASAALAFGFYRARKRAGHPPRQPLFLHSP